ncbi:MAG: oxygen-independent coproporphyrinogen-3 oxidase [Saprospiraceae bacterium]|jgi:oxygen-independent coproporphyrinogen-3 oxidase
MIDAICKEIQQRDISNYNNTLGSIYFGGGTPSLLSKSELGNIFETLAKKFTWSESIEITLEANPEDISAAYLANLKSIGVNRLSVGIQSFDAEDLSYMNRAHSVAQSHSALNLINEEGFKSYTLDLMFGLINRTTQDWEDNLATALKYSAPHISCYNLTIEEQTAFAKWKSNGSLLESKDSIQKEQYDLAESILTSNGYAHYEISNYAIEGHNAVHNSNYWNKISYIGYGPGAHSYSNGARSWNVANNSKYIRAIDKNISCQESEELSQADQFNELIMLGLRTKKGIAKKDIEKQQPPIQKHWNALSADLLKEGILIEENEAFSLDHSWWYLSDDIASRLFLEN